MSPEKLPEHRLVALDESDGRVLGWVAMADVSKRAAYAGVVEHSVYVHPAARGRGVGLALLAALIATTEAAGIWSLRSGIFPRTPPASPCTGADRRWRGYRTSCRAWPRSAGRARRLRATDGEPRTVLGAPSGPGQWRVIEDGYLGAVGSASWSAACVHGGTVHGPGGSSGADSAARGARVRSPPSNRTPPAAAAASRAIATE
jgi:Acetyltransferase (GNAT) family